MPLVEIKGFNALFDNKPLFEQSEKNKQEAYEKRMITYTIKIFINSLHWYRLIKANKYNYSAANYFHRKTRRR